MTTAFCLPAIASNTPLPLLYRRHTFRGTSYSIQPYSTIEAFSGSMDGAPLPSMTPCILFRLIA